MTSQSPEVRDWRMSVLVLGWNETTGETPGKAGNAGYLCRVFTRKVDMEMWKNFPLPP